MTTKIIIPARFQSSRFPGKPLVDICGQSLIERVWKKCCIAANEKDVYIATDSDKIFDHCKIKNMQCIKTSDKCLTGTDRVFEAAEKLNADLIVNVQGDEPLIDPADIVRVINTHLLNPKAIHCGMCAIKSEQDFRSASVPKVVCGPNNKLLYMSRAAIPTDKNLKFRTSMKQVCIYAFPMDALKAFASYGKKTHLESIEDIEILRFMELGYDVEMVEVSDSSISVDFPEDVLRVVNAIKNGAK